MASFRVNKLTKAIVAAALPRQEHWLPQSNIDLIFPGKAEVHVVFCYRKPEYSFGSVVDVLKTALSKTLVPYYAVAGEMVTNGAGEAELLCNNRGVDFEEAYADVELRDLNLHKPDESIYGKLLPELKNGVMAAQATQLSCGGVVVGCTFDHRVADAYSANMFWKSWAEMARSKPLTTIPSFRRSLLSPRNPGAFDSSVTNVYVPKSNIFPSLENGTDNVTHPPPLLGRIYSVPAKQIHCLQLLANHQNPNSHKLKRTKIEAFSAFIWKLMASETDTGSNSFKLAIAIDGRTRISKSEMSNYFGNVVSHSFGKKKCSDLKEMPLSSIADEIHNFLNVATTEEHFLGLIDFVNAHRPEPIGFRLHEAKVGKEEQTLFVSSGRGFPVTEMDFGWGSPVFGSYLSTPYMPDNYVLPFPSAFEDGNWIVFARLTEDQVEVMENAGAHIFKPFCLE